MSAGMRSFDGGATRSTLEGKLSYTKTLDPLVLTKYVEYIGRHRVQADGNLRNWDNWKSGMPEEVWLDSLMRHVWVIWTVLHENTRQDRLDDDSLNILYEALGGAMFNTIGLWAQTLRERKEQGVPDGVKND